MPSEAPVLQTQTEKPNHYTYLKEFRTQQCPLFLQHKCTNHRPFTCFHWHFMNQRRRRPIRRRDGTFNYSPDTYCTKYDETTGICSDGDDCSFLHRTAGDTERRYHLRYYKTSVCVHETDGKGFCTKNGHHCAFAHGVHDMRNPVHDVREMQDAGIGAGVNNVADSPLGTTVEKDRQINEDPKWNDTNYVLANYKTDPCKRPPRLCRQGYACPSYHNTRDRRRSPKKIKYRSTPCPNVKHGDDWGDPSQCENQDNCTYCHTRTEQQFHPEIYKSSKCNDMVQAGYCPRGPFCAFAHVEQEMTNQREYAADMDNNLSHFFDIILPDTEEEKQQAAQNGGNGQNAPSNALPPAHSVTEQHNTNGGSFFNSSSSSVSRGWGLSGHASSFPEPIGKGRTGSFSSSVASDGFLSKAPGSERVEHGSIKQLLTAIDNDMSIDHAEKQKRKQDLVMSYSQSNAPLSPCSIGSNIWNADPASASGTSSQPGNNPFSVTMSPNANSYYPPGDTVESVIGNALEEDLNMGEMTINDLAKDTDNDSNSVCSSLSTGFNGGSHAQGGYLGATSVPVSIPSSGGGPTSNNGIGGLDWSPGTSPMGSMHGAGAAASAHLQKLQGGSAATAFLSQPNTTSKLAASVGYSSSLGTATDFNSSSSSTITPGAGASSMSPLFTAGQFAAMNGSRYNEEQHLREELAAYKLRLEQWENSMGQAREACVAWQREAETATRRLMQMEEDRVQAYKQRDEALAKVSQQSKEVDFVKNNPWFHAVTRGSELENLPVSVIKQMQAQLIVDLDMLEKLVYQKEANKCLICKENNRAVGVRPCNHYVMCERCAGSCTECPFCKQAIEQRTSAIMPGNAVSGGGSSASNNNQQQLPSHQSSASAL